MITVECIAELSGHQNPIYTVENSQKPHIFFTAGNDKGVVEWSLKTREFVRVMMPVATSVYALHCPSFLPVMITGERNGRASVYSFAEQKVTHTLDNHCLPVFDIRSVGSKKEILLSSEDGSVSVWETAGFSLVYRFTVSAETVRVMAISPDEKLIAFGCKDSVIRVYNLEDYSLLTELKGHTMPVTALQFSPDGTRLLSGSRDALLNVWDAATFSLLQTIPAHMFTVYDIKFHPTLPYFATASRDKSIKIWGADDLKLYKIISREKGIHSHHLSINKIAWSPYNENLISIGDDKLIFVWDVRFG